MALFSFFSSCFILPMAALYLAAVSLWTNSLLVLVCSASMTFKRGKRTGWAARHNYALLIISINSNFIISPISSCQESEGIEKAYFQWTYLKVFPKKTSNMSGLQTLCKLWQRCYRFSHNPSYRKFRRPAAFGITHFLTQLDIHKRSNTSRSHQLPSRAMFLLPPASLPGTWLPQQRAGRLVSSQLQPHHSGKGWTSTTAEGGLKYSLAWITSH